MNIAEAAAHICKHKDTIRRAIASGKLDAVKVNNVWDITEEALLHYASLYANEDLHIGSIEELNEQNEGVLHNALHNADDGAAYMHADMQRLRTENDQQRRKIEELENILKDTREELKDSRRTMDDASQRHDTIVLQLTRQLENSQRMLEAHQESWWRRIFRRRRNDD